MSLSENKTTEQLHINSIVHQFLQLSV